MLDIALRIALLAACLVIIGFGALALWGWLKLRKFRRWAEEMKTSLGGGDLVPRRIHLNEDPMPRWLGEKDALPHVTDLKEAGFIFGTAYLLREMDGVNVVFIRHPQSGATGGFCRHELAGACWTDLVAIYTDGSSLTVSNNPKAAGMAHRPEAQKIFLPGASPAELLKSYQDNLDSSKGQIQLTKDNFREQFEEEYARDMKWRDVQGGVSREEIEWVAKLGGQSLSAKELEAAFAETKRDELERLANECIDYYVSQHPDEQEELGYDLFAVSDSFSREPFAEYLSGFLEMEEGRAKAFLQAADPDVTSGQLFERMVESLSPSLRPKLQGHVEQPVPARIYRTVDGL